MASSQTLFGPDSDSGRGSLGRGHYSSSRSSRDGGSKIRGGFNHFSDVFRYEYKIEPCIIPVLFCQKGSMK